jgi:thiosulfate reductase cytochrome b subunit
VLFPRPDEAICPRKTEAPGTAPEASDLYLLSVWLAALTAALTRILLPSWFLVPAGLLLLLAGVLLLTSLARILLLLAALIFLVRVLISHFDSPSVSLIGSTVERTESFTG